MIRLFGDQIFSPVSELSLFIVTSNEFLQGGHIEGVLVTFPT